MNSASAHPRAYILHNRVSHARLLPAAARHAFVYPTLSLLLSLRALEAGQLDLLRGWLFGYGGLWGRVTGLRPSAYLHDTHRRDDRSITHKLVDALDERGWPGDALDDAWLMTMPSFLGFEGINPLTVYFCYRRGSPSLWLVILEIHNTFGERSIHVLETGKSEDPHSGSGFDHQWTFPRQFHVSPFNDRSGHYTCQLTTPPHPPSAPHPRPPRPVVKITLLTAPPHPQPKLRATLRATASTPLSSPALLAALARAPLALLLTFPRIAYHALHLHYRKRLDVYPRPEPRAPNPALEARLPPAHNPVQPTPPSIGGAIAWQPEGPLERWCRLRVLALLRTRTTPITLIPTNPSAASAAPPAPAPTPAPALTIHYRSPRLFTLLFTAPSPQHALRLGRAHRIFAVSDDALFLAAFAPAPAAPPRLAQRVRRALAPAPPPVPAPARHALDEPPGLAPLCVLAALWLLAVLEHRLFAALRVRYVPGHEPERADAPCPAGALGSVRRDAAD